MSWFKDPHRLYDLDIAIVNYFASISGNTGSPTTVSLDASQLNTITTIYSGINGKGIGIKRLRVTKTGHQYSSCSSFTDRNAIPYRLYRIGYTV